MTNEEARAPSSDGLTILYEDEHLVAVHKPIGMFVHRSRESGPGERFLLQTARDQLGRKLYPVHRLDRPTSGIVLFALNSECASVISEQFRNRVVVKHYEAVVRGFPPDRMLLNRPLARMTDQASTAAGSESNALSSTTLAVTLDRWEIPVASDRYPATRCSRLELSPKTGRRHQIRRHLKHASYPILGDKTHGDNRLNHMLAESIGLHRMMLIAIRLQLRHPVSRMMLVIDTVPDSDYRLVLETIESIGTRQ